jgi:hypothetical protein
MGKAQRAHQQHPFGIRVMCCMCGRVRWARCALPILRSRATQISRRAGARRSQGWPLIIIPPRAEGIRYTSPWFNHGRNERTANPLPQTKPRTVHHTYQPVGNPRARMNDRHTRSHPEPKASGIPVQPWAKRAHRQPVAPSQAPNGASNIPARGESTGTDERPPHPIPPRAEGIRYTSSTMGETSAPPTRCPKPSPERGITHTSPWGIHGHG